MRKKLQVPVLTFHRYLPATHGLFLEEIQKIQTEAVYVFPLFPQFSYATTGSIARWFGKHLSVETVSKMRWIQSYPTHPAFVAAFQKCIRDFLREKELLEEKTALLFSAHGLPKSFISGGDVYQTECERSFDEISRGFVKARSLLAYQSQFGKGKWIQPSTLSLSEKVASWIEANEQVVLIPLSFTSDHIETLYEMEELYLPVIRNRGWNAYRCPALNRNPDWINAIISIIQQSHLVSNSVLVRPKK